MWSRLTRQLIDIACEEDLGAAGDITAPLLPQATVDVVARVVARRAGVICGLALGPVVCEVFAQRLGKPLQFSAAERDGHAWLGWSGGHGGGLRGDRARAAGSGACGGADAAGIFSDG
jgi:nicotinate-nucleotide pyrophosphorylase